MNFNTTSGERRLGRPANGRRIAHLALALGFGTSLATGPLAPAFADSAPPSGSLNERLPSLAPIVERVLPAVVNISVVQQAGADQAQQSQPDQNDDGDENDDQDQDQGPQGPGPNGQTPFDELLRRFFEQQQQGRHGGGVPMPSRKITALGSGFIIDPAGYVVTNNHVVGSADKVTVIFQDDSRHPAKIVGKDAKTDLALLKIDAPQPLPSVKFGDSDKARVGDWVFAVGNPFGLGGTVTKGIISARGRSVEEGNYLDFLQVDASINRGNSGGPTFDLDGNVIGINTVIYSPNGGSVGIGFAIPSNAAMIVLDQLRNTGHVDRGFLGVQVQEVTSDIASSLGLDANHPTGALVAQVNDGSPADKAGVKVGDIIQKFDGKPVDKMRDLPRIVAETGIGRKVDITLFRQGKTLTVSTTVGQFDDTKTASAQTGPGDDGKPNRMASLGLSLSSLNADARKRLGIGKDVDGVLISRVKEGSPAADRGIQAGDVIVQVNGEKVSKPEEVSERVKAKPDAKSILLLVNRHGTNLFVPLTPDDKNG
ncbi:MAG TPA: DegQ family serine endoprotease [Aliidongia sp.]|nr:DegQ family serine endoprotease [Aliidongia sp.]